MSLSYSRSHKKKVDLFDHKIDIAHFACHYIILDPLEYLIDRDLAVTGGD